MAVGVREREVVGAPLDPEIEALQGVARRQEVIWAGLRVTLHRFVGGSVTGPAGLRVSPWWFRVGGSGCLGTREGR